MNTIPQPFWAIMLAFFGVVIGLSVLFHPGNDNIALAVLALGANLISGALGAFAGHALATNSNKVIAETATINTTPPDKEIQ